MTMVRMIRTNVDLDLQEDVYKEIDHKQPSEKAVIEGPKQWAKHVKKIR